MQLDIEKSIRRDLSKKGYFIALFEAEEDEPAYAYTIGLYDNYEHAEIVVFGLDIETMTILLSDACERIKLDESFEVKQDYDDFLEGYKLTFQHTNVDEYKGLFGYGIDNNQGVEFPMIQMIWPDQQHKYPWDEEFDENLLPRQPLLV